MIVFIYLIFVNLYFNCVFGTHYGLYNDNLYRSVLNSTLCLRHLKQMNVLQFLDAGFRIPQSLLLGSQGSLGNYDQCLAIKQDLPGTVIEGKYCIIDVPYEQDKLKLPFSLAGVLNGGVDEFITGKTEESEDAYKLRLGMTLLIGSSMANLSSTGKFKLSKPALRIAICVPKSCTVREVVSYFNLENIDYTERFCRLPKDKLYSTSDYVGIGIFSIIGLLTLSSTAYDLIVTFNGRKETTEFSKLLKCCSIYTNTSRLFTFKDDPDNITCLDGIRALSIIWIICGHTLLSFSVTTAINPLTFIKWLNSYEAVWLTPFQLAVDTFFMISGLLTVYSAVNKTTKRALFTKLHIFYGYRLLRIFPLLAAVVVFQMSIFRLMGDGPTDHFLNELVNNCRTWWWTTFLNVQNYVNRSNMCIPHSWYLAVDTQLHFLSPLVLYWILGNRRSATTGLAAGLLVSVVVAIVYSLVTDYRTFSLTSMVIGGLYDYKKYVNVIPRAPAFVVGMAFGYIIHVQKEFKSKLPKSVVTCNWIISITLLCGVAYLTFPQLKFSSVLLNFFNGILRPLWALSIGWIIFACKHGYGGPINWFLCLTVWKFISRISYALYLFHYPVQFIIRGTFRNNTFFTLPNFMFYFVNDFVLAVVAATIMCIIIDAPCSTIVKTLFLKVYASEKIANVKKIQARTDGVTKS